MFQKLNKTKLYESKLYNKIVFLSRNKLLYTKFKLNDTFQNRINLIFLHVSFLFVKVKDQKNKNTYNDFYQKMFDFIFNKIELNMREIGYGDISVNKNMKFLVKIFYDILMNCENYEQKSLNLKNTFFQKHLTMNNDLNNSNINELIKYFDEYQAFCLDLSSDKVLKGDLNFNYK